MQKPKGHFDALKLSLWGTQAWESERLGTHRVNHVISVHFQEALTVRYCGHSFQQRRKCSIHQPDNTS
jgi:hypothetical protein